VVLTHGPVSAHRPGSGRVDPKERRRTAGTAQFIGPQAERVTFEDLAAMYLTDYKINGRRTPKHAERYVQNLRQAFGLERALDITADRINAYTVQRLEEGRVRGRGHVRGRERGLQPATVNRELAALGRMFSLAVRAGKLPHRPRIAKLDESGNVREGFLEPAEFEAVCNAKNKVGKILPAHLEDALRFAYLTGWRIGAVRALEWRDVDLRGRTVRLRSASAKNKRPEEIPARGELLALLKRREADRRLDCTCVFHHDGKPLGDHRKRWRAACKAAGLSGIIVHDLRRSAARNALRTGKIPERVVMELGGWRTRSVFDRYNVTSEKDLANAVEAISEYVTERGAERPRVEPLPARRTETE